MNTHYNYSNFREQLFQKCIDIGISEESFNCILDLTLGYIQNEKLELHKANESLIEIERKYENGKKVILELTGRHNSKMMSVYYLLDTILSAGTHHEKAVVITHLKKVCSDLCEKDNLPLSDNLLPF